MRGQLGFEGFVVSDWAAVAQLQNQGAAASNADCAKLSINAGLDLDMCSKCYIETLEELVKSGEVSEETIDLSVKRILRLKFAKNLFENPYCEKIELDRTEHLKLARKAAGESMILLKNNGVLPLKKDMTIAVAGPFLRERRALLGSWTLDGRAEETPNFLEAISNAVVGGRIVCDADDVSVYSNIDVISRKADVIVLALGESEKATGEGRSVADISLNKDQIDLIARAKATGKKVVGVFFCGRPIAMQGVADMLDGVIYAWHCGSETANAACDILFGDVNPSGKTPVTFAKKTGHIPLYYNVTSSGRPVNCYYGQNPQNCYVDGGSEPYYPFGYGLSYTTFKYSKLKTDNPSLTLAELENGKKFKISVELENTGDFDGKEVAQLYIRDIVASTMRPLRELKAFKKVFLKRGQSETVNFELGFDDLGFYTANGEYIVEKGDFEIFVGEHCLTKNKLLISVK